MKQLTFASVLPVAVSLMVPFGRLERNRSGTALIGYVQPRLTRASTCSRVKRSFPDALVCMQKNKKERKRKRT